MSGLVGQWPRPRSRACTHPQETEVDSIMIDVLHQGVGYHARGCARSGRVPSTTIRRVGGIVCRDRPHRFAEERCGDVRRGMTTLLRGRADTRAGAGRHSHRTESAGCSDRTVQADGTRKRTHRGDPERPRNTDLGGTQFTHHAAATTTARREASIPPDPLGAFVSPRRGLWSRQRSARSRPESSDQMIDRRVTASGGDCMMH